MKKLEINGAAPYLPDEIITNILSRLPAKSLMRFQCVCKYWQNLFKTPSFIADHLRRSHQNPSLIFSQDYVRNSLRLRLMDCEMQVGYIQKVPPPFNSLTRWSAFHIIGSSNGLLCLEIYKSSTSLPSLLVWNPVTRDVREVTKSRNISKCGCKYHYVLGFGFSTAVNDYKIMAIYSKKKIFFETYPVVCGVDVFSLSRNSWKEIEFGNLQDVTCFNSSVSVNGAIFTNGFTWEKDDFFTRQKERVIVSFDIATEEITLIPWPPLSGSNHSFELTVHEDKLAVLAILNTSEFTRHSSNIELWVIDEYIGSPKERWNWTKKFTSGPYPWTFYLGTTWRDEIVVSGIKSGEKYARICRFNVTTNGFKTLAISRHVPCSNYVNYVESLEPIVNIRNIQEP